MFKKFVVVASCFALAACGRPIEYNLHKYQTYGLLNSDTQKSDKMCYEVSIGNLIWGILLFETVVAPVYFFGFSLFNPIGPKDSNGNCVKVD